MSAVTGSRPFESRLRHHLTLYADGCEIEIADADEPDRKSYRLSGKTAIKQWMTRTFAPDVGRRIVGSHIRGRNLEVIEECRYTDGSSTLLIRTATISRGRISRESIRSWRTPSRSDKWPAPEAEPATMTDDHPVHSPPGRPATTLIGLRSDDRSLPGNYLG
jgi:hypothetical protein